MKLDLILAIDDKNGIGKDGKLPWSIREDLKYFQKITSTTKDLAKLNAVVMGRKTWESIPSNHRPLKERINCILTKSIKTNDTNSKIDDFVLYFNSLEKCLKELETKDNLEKIFIIGGASLFNELVKTDLVDKVYLTKIKGDFKCDTFFDGITKDFKKISSSSEKKEGDYSFEFEIYRK